MNQFPVVHFSQYAVSVFRQTMFRIKPCYKERIEKCGAGVKQVEMVLTDIGRAFLGIANKVHIVPCSARIVVHI